MTGGALVGDVGGRCAIVVDDLVTTGTTLSRAALASRDHGATAVLAAVTHGLFSAGAAGCLEAAPIERLVLTDSVPRPVPLDPDRVRVVPIDALVADAVACLHADGSLVELRG